MPQLSYTKEDVIQAMLDVIDNSLSQNQAAQKNGVPQTTLSDRLRGLPSKSEITQPAQILSKSQESRLVTWILRQEALGYAPSHSQVRATVTALLRQQGRERHIGVHWLARFIKRHPDIEAKVGKRQEAARFSSFTPMAVNWYFGIRESEYGWIKPENTVNVDEGGIMAGFGLDSLVIGSSDPRRKAFLKGSQSRTWTSFIEAVTADGRLLKPGIIFKGKELQKQWFIDEFNKIADWYYITSDNGWTDNHIAVEWLKEVYLPQTQPADESDARLIILDGHGSHVSDEWMATSLIHAEIQPDKKETTPGSDGHRDGQVDSDNTPKTSRHIRDLGKNKSPSTRRRYSVISKGFEAQESKIASLSTRIASLEEEVGRLSRGKKRKAVPNPNKKFMTLAEALATGDTISEPNEAVEGAGVVEDVIEVGGMEEDERSYSGKEELGVVRTRTGRGYDRQVGTVWYGNNGLRVIALASIDNVPENPLLQTADSTEQYAQLEQNMTFLGLVCMLDPPREEVPHAVKQCKDAGIRVIVITGDNRNTAESICQQIGVFGQHEDLTGKSYTGREFDQLTPNEQLEAAKRASLFSRVEPSHKSRLVDLLQSLGEVVAMTGDGVNDAPALKKADIGVAMGSGTDVSKLAADMVLADSNFATIEVAIEEGRSIYNNTQQFIRYLISSNIGEVVSIFLTAALGMPEALVPVQLLWVNLVTDGLPATALSFSPPDHDIMKRRPRKRDEALIGGWLFFRYLVIGTYVGLATVAGYAWWFMYNPEGPQITFRQLTRFHHCSTEYSEIGCAMFFNDMAKSALTVSLSILVVIEMFNAMNALSSSESLLTLPLWKNMMLVYAIALSMALHFALLYIPFLQGLFSILPLNTLEWKAVVLISAPVVLLDEILKAIERQFFMQKTTDVSLKTKKDQ
ncbi:hypothetical protein FPOA_13184 [Fusarium poae]|uniref:HTH CENPB-type domain-containing protein n=1 Tax=Fusarium poae TaxID=36050 RepID=A0A1B8A6J8_FUSPO|nr:hypothetical protein FPOA_13179 [Fusarium poae]OBS16107.1 hypothetical protein FPOA_13184 [Fusarium poae]